MTRSPVRAGPIPPPAVRFTFDDSPDAELADGRRAAPLEATGVAFVPGLGAGQALLAGDGLVLRYPRALLPLHEGSVAMWVRLTRPAASSSSARWSRARAPCSGTCTMPPRSPA